MLTEAQRQALVALAECFAEDGILIDAQNIRAALAAANDAEFRATSAEADGVRLRSQLEDARQRVAALEAAALAGGWKQRAEEAETEIERLKRERNDARATAQGILASLKEQGEAADAAEAAAAILSDRVAELEWALREAVSAMRGCVALTAVDAAGREGRNGASAGHAEDAAADEAEDAVAGDQAADAHGAEAADGLHGLTARQDDGDGEGNDGEDEQSGHRELPSGSPGP